MPTLESTRHLHIERVARATLLAMCFAPPMALISSAQGGGAGMPHPMLPQPIGQSVGNGLDDTQNGYPVENDRLLRLLNADRQKSLVADTNKLLRLVNELNAEIARTSPDSLTPSQLHKVAEIEKLAHDVKDKMSTSVRGAPAFQSPFQPVRH